VCRMRLSLRIVFPTIALCYVQAGRSREGGRASFWRRRWRPAERTGRDGAPAGSTYFVRSMGRVEALHWLRRAIIWVNENYPWFSMKSRRGKLTGHGDF